MTRGGTGLKRLFIGSTAEQIVCHAVLPCVGSAESNVVNEAAKNRHAKISE